MTCHSLNLGMTRRDFFERFAFGLGGVALAKLLNLPVRAGVAAGRAASLYQGLPGFPNFAPRANPT